MLKPNLKLPKTLRFPTENEIPMNSSVLEKLKLSKNSNIIPGFTFQLKDNNIENKELHFKFYAEINIDNPKLWDLIIALSMTLPENCALIFGHIDFEINYGNYENKYAILNYIKEFETELTQDTFMNWGLIYHDGENLIEIFVDESKFLKYWGTDEERFRQIMNNFELKENKNLEFIDEYPKVRESIQLHFQNVLNTKELIDNLQEKFIV
ncbi:hypothetical protein [Chishuiella sp.]|uniref:hypothetical protein n=1 Tax=Chishuiella sp. TaxID=1969467 RepID=UPI0028AE52C3|nr:hypothetical protein [Chishuiella sp.]